ncbi:DUF6597 domain-containing transcriptional factor [Leptospira sp. WS92.C1]
MEYSEISPPGPLKNDVKCIWVLEGQVDWEISELEVEKVLPDGCSELIFHTGDLFQRSTSGSEFEIQPRSFYYGQLKRFLLLKPTGKIDIIAVRFFPWGFRSIFPIPSGEFTELCTSIDLIWNQMGKELEEKIQIAKTKEERVEIIFNFLISNLIRNKRKNPNAMAIVKGIVQTEGLHSVRSIRDRFEIEERTLERYFHEFVGLTPKHFMKITRLQHFLKVAEGKKILNFSQLAQECRFFDQSHLIREFKNFVGVTPKEYFEKDRHFTEFFIG